MIRVLLADDEAMIRAGVAAILATDPGIEIVAEASDGAQAVELARAHRPDVAMLDIRMPNLDGLAAAAELRRTLPGVAVVMLTTFDEDAYVAQALSQGASGFMLKAADPRELIIGVKAVADGAAYLSPRIAQRVITKLNNGKLERAAPARDAHHPLPPARPARGDAARHAGAAPRRRGGRGARRLAEPVHAARLVGRACHRGPAPRATPPGRAGAWDIPSPPSFCWPSTPAWRNRSAAPDRTMTTTRMS